MRILRIFKMVRHFVGLQSILYTLHEAWKELGIIMLVVTITMLIFSSLLFAFEQSGPIAESWSASSSFPKRLRIGYRFELILAPGFSTTASCGACSPYPLLATTCNPRWRFTKSTLPPRQRWVRFCAASVPCVGWWSSPSPSRCWSPALPSLTRASCGEAR